MIWMLGSQLCEVLFEQYGLAETATNGYSRLNPGVGRQGRAAADAPMNRGYAEGAVVTRLEHADLHSFEILVPSFPPRLSST